jgi:hypothetical protein
MTILSNITTPTTETLYSHISSITTHQISFSPLFVNNPPKYKAISKVVHAISRFFNTWPSLNKWSILMQTALDAEVAPPHPFTTSPRNKYSNRKVVRWEEAGRSRSFHLGGACFFDHRRLFFWWGGRSGIWA